MSVKDSDKIIELMGLSNKHPELNINFMVNYEVVGDDHNYWLCNIIKIEVKEQDKKIQELEKALELASGDIDCSSYNNGICISSGKKCDNVEKINCLKEDYLSQARMLSNVQTEIG